MKTIVVLAGKPGVGKSTLARLVQDGDPNVEVLDVGAALSGWISEDVPRDTIGEEFISRYGVPGIGLCVNEAIGRLEESRTLIVDAIRHRVTWEVIEAEYPTSHLIGVTCAEHDRLGRLARRLQGQAHPNVPQALGRYKQFDEVAEDLLLAAHLRVENTGPLAELRFLLQAMRESGLF